MNTVLITRLSLLLLYTVFSIIWRRELKHISVANRTPFLPKDNYEFVVIGAGSAGVITACRLAQAGRDVLLIEAGGAQDSILTDHSGLFAAAVLKGGDRLWNYTNVPQIVGKAFKGIPESKGHVLGGSSTVNFMMYQRGNRKDYDLLAEEIGDQTWSYDNVLPMFMKTENNTDPTISEEYHGREGPVGMSSPLNPAPILDIMARVANEHGYTTQDVNGVNQTGFMITQLTSRNGIRSSTATAFLESGLCPKLTTITKAFVTKILFNNDEQDVPIANGVLFEKNGRVHKVYARKEVILSAGPISSSHILMLSGVGPVDHLSTHGIPIVKALPVGENLCNHVAIFNLALLSDPSLVNKAPELNLDQLYAADVEGTGPLAQPALSTWYRTSRSRPESEQNYPDHILYSTPVWKGVPSLIKLAEFHDDHAWQEYIGDLMQYDYLNMIPCLTRPRSRGTIRLKSADPHDMPLIDPQFLQNPLDMQDMTDLVTFSFKLIQNSSLANYSYVNPRPIPGCAYCPDRPVADCQSYIECFVKQFTLSLFHPVGTCRMGDPNSADTVVDTRLRVKGIRGLRVVDSSVFPHCINTNTNAPAMLVGEMGAHFILQDQFS